MAFILLIIFNLALLQIILDIFSFLAVKSIKIYMEKYTQHSKPDVVHAPNINESSKQYILSFDFVKGFMVKITVELYNKCTKNITPYKCFEELKNYKYTRFNSSTSVNEHFHLFDFHQQQRFYQTYFTFPVVSLTSHFTSDSFGHPGSEPQLQKEGVRLVTFKNFPHSVPVSAIRLAQAGFYYTGEGDKVKCFSCGMTYQGWELGDKPSSIHARISPDCLFVLGQESSNSPLPPHMTREPDFSQPQPPDSGYFGSLTSLQTSGSLNLSSLHTSSPLSPSSLQISNPLELQVDGSTQAESLRTHSDNDSVSRPLSTTSSSNGSLHVGPIASQINTSSFSVTSPSSGLASSQQALPLSSGTGHSMPTHRLDLGGAVYPLYSQMDARKRSFHNWQPVRGLPGVDDLIALGFFYAGYADCVRCFYCGIGLKSWEPGDDPAKVHASWRPNCEYLRLVKGDDFVDSVTGGRTSRSGMSSSSRTPSNPASNLQETRTNANLETSQQSSTGSETENSELTLQRVNSSSSVGQLSDTPAVRAARQSGYSDSEISAGIVQAESLGLDPNNDNNLMDILDNMFTNGSSQNRELPDNNTEHLGSVDSTQTRGDHGDVETDGIDTAPGAEASEAMTMIQRRQQLKEENTQLREMRTCHLCHQKTVGVIFLPCGHIITCADCAPHVRRCLRCSEVVRATANVFFT